MNEADPNKAASEQAQQQQRQAQQSQSKTQRSRSTTESETETDIGFATAVAECVNECCDEFGHPTKVVVPEGRGAEREGPLGDLVLTEAEKVLQTMVSTVGPKVISAFIAALKKRFPA